MAALDWCQLVAEVIAEFAVNNATREYLRQRLREKGDYALALGQFEAGATERVVRQLLRRGLLEITGQTP